MSQFFKAFVVAALFFSGLSACEDTIDETNNNDTEVDDINVDPDATAFVTLFLEYQDDPLGEVQDEECEFTASAVNRSPITIPTGIEIEVPANVPITVNIRGGKHRTDLTPGWVVMPTMNVTLAPGEHKTINVTGNPAWYQDNGDEWYLLDCRSVAVDRPDDRRPFTTTEADGGVGVQYGYQLPINVGHMVKIEFDGPKGVMVDTIDGNEILEDTLEISDAGLVFRMTTSGSSNYDFDCFFDK